MAILIRREQGFYRRLMKLSMPIVLQNLITFSLGLIDTFMVSQLGNTEMAAVTAANVPVFLLISIVFGVQSGLGILVSQYWGKQDMKSISRSIGVASFVGAAVAAVLAAVLFLWPVQIMDLMSNKHQLSILGAPYLKLIGISYIFNMLSSVYASAQRSAENPSFGMKLFGASTLINTGLNYLLIFGKLGFPMLGIQGAAIATLCARICEFIICTVYALRDKRIRMQWAAFVRPGWDMLRRFLKYASPVVLNEACWGMGNSMLTVILGYTENSVEMLAAIALALLPTLFLPVVFPMFKLFGESATIAAALAVTSFASIPLHAYSISSITGVLRSGGDVLWSAALDLAPQWIVCLPLTALCALVLKTGIWPIALAMQTESVAKMPLCIYRVRSRKWIHDVTANKEML